MSAAIQPIHVWLTLITTAGVIIGFLWKINRSFNRVIDIMIEYPPHRHVKFNGNDVVLFPKGYTPGDVLASDKAKSVSAGV